MVRDADNKLGIFTVCRKLGVLHEIKDEEDGDEVVCNVLDYSSTFGLDILDRDEHSLHTSAFYLFRNEPAETLNFVDTKAKMQEWSIKNERKL